MTRRIDVERVLDPFLAPDSDQLPDRVIDAALAEIARTPQRRALRVPWRFPTMPAFTRAAGIAAVTLAVSVGAVGLLYLNVNAPTGVGGATVAPSTAPSAATPAPTVMPTAGPSFVAPGSTGWRRYTSEAHGFAFGVPEGWSVAAPAERAWQAGDRLAGSDAWPFADTFVSPDDDSIGLFVWEMPAGPGVDTESVDGLKVVAQASCDSLGVSSCDGFAQRALPMCLNAGGDRCRGAILVPTPGAQYAFVMDWISAMFTNSPDLVRVVVIPREDDFPAAARYGGSVELLRSILTTMDVWAPGQKQAPVQWIMAAPAVAG